MTNSARTPLSDIRTGFKKASNDPGAAASYQRNLKVPGSPIISSSPSKCGSESAFTFSSSPPRSSLSRCASILPSSPPPLPSSPAGCRSSPASATSSDILPIAASIHFGETVYIGRKLKRVQDGVDVKKITLPKAAKHASRRHCRVWLEKTETGDAELIVDVLGQNGMILSGEKVAQGEIRVALAGKLQTVSLGFYSGVEVALTAVTAGRVVPQTAVGTHQQEDSVPTSEATLPLDLPSSPPSHRSRSSSVLALDQQEPKRPLKRQRQNQSKRSSSVAAPSPYAHQDDDGFPPESSSEEEEEEGDEVDSKAKRAELAQLEEASLAVKAAIVKLNLDLTGSISSNLVFQPRATLTTSECVALLLESQPTLRDVGSEQAWRPSVLHCLRTGPFGRIDHNGLKDASGKKLETNWHYSPSMDSDTTRRNSLSPFVKQVRQSVLGRKQYFYKRPSDLSKRRRW